MEVSARASLRCAWVKMMAENAGELLSVGRGIETFPNTLLAY